MKKKIYSLIAVAGVIATLVIFVSFEKYSFLAEGHVIRRVHWGMSQEEVMSSEKDTARADAENTNDSPVLRYKDTVFEKEALLSYGFWSGKTLVHAAYHFEYAEKSPLPMADFQLFLFALKQKYGEPDISIYATDEHSNKMAILAVGSGNPSAVAVWDRPDKVIKLILFRPDDMLPSFWLNKNSPSIMLSYAPPLAGATQKNFREKI